MMQSATETRSERPRSADAIVAATFALYRRYPTLFVVLAAGVIVPYDLIVLAAVGAGPFSRGDTSVAVQLTLALVSWVLIGPLVSALHVHAVADVRQGRGPRLGAVAAQGIKVLPVVAAATIISGLGIALGLVALIVPGIILAFRWFVVAQAAAIEHEGWLPALRRSRELTAGNYTHIFIFALYLGVIVSVPTSVVSLAFGSHDASAVAFLVGLVVQVFSASFGALTTALLYYDLRTRRQGSGQPGVPEG
jgi:hypothetical protein